MIGQEELIDQGEHETQEREEIGTLSSISSG